MHTPLISVVMVTYNGSAYVEEQILSVLQQTEQNFELIILDNASQDDTYALLQKYALLHNKIKLYRNTENIGVNKGFEQAMLLGKGTFIAPCDQDDIWESDKLEVMVQYLQGVVQFAFSRPGQFEDGKFNERRYPASYLYRDVTDPAQLVFHTPVSGHASMFKREVLQKCLPFPQDIYYDWWISLNVAFESTLKYVPKTLTWQRLHSKNTSLQTYKRTQNEQRNIIRKERIELLEMFFYHQKQAVGTVAGESLLEYLLALKSLKPSAFSRRLFLYAWKNKERILHYKKKRVGFLSHLKYAFRMAKRGV